MDINKEYFPVDQKINYDNNKSHRILKLATLINPNKFKDLDLVNEFKKHLDNILS